MNLTKHKPRILPPNTETRPVVKRLIADLWQTQFSAAPLAEETRRLKRENAVLRAAIHLHAERKAGRWPISDKLVEVPLAATLALCVLLCAGCYGRQEHPVTHPSQFKTSHPENRAYFVGGGVSYEGNLNTWTNRTLPPAPVYPPKKVE